MDTMNFNATMLFLMIGGLVNSIVALPSTWLIGVYGVIGNAAGIAYFGYKAWKGGKEKK